MRNRGQSRVGLGLGREQLGGRGEEAGRKIGFGSKAGQRGREQSQSCGLHTLGWGCPSDVQAQTGSQLLEGAWGSGLPRGWGHLGVMGSGPACIASGGREGTPWWRSPAVQGLWQLGSVPAPRLVDVAGPHTPLPLLCPWLCAVRRWALPVCGFRSVPLQLAEGSRKSGL